MTLPKNQDKLRKYKKKIADIDKFLKNEDTLKDEGLGNNIGVKSRGYYETDDEQENYPSLESESLKDMYKEILNDKMIKDYVIKTKKEYEAMDKKVNSHILTLPFGLNFYYDEILRLVYMKIYLAIQV